MKKLVGGGVEAIDPGQPLPRVVVRVPGKVNLQLSVGPKEDDGFHGVVTVFSLHEIKGQGLEHPPTLVKGEAAQGGVADRAGVVQDFTVT